MVIQELMATQLLMSAHVIEGSQLIQAIQALKSAQVLKTPQVLKAIPVLEIALALQAIKVLKTPQALQAIHVLKATKRFRDLFIFQSLIRPSLQLLQLPILQPKAIVIQWANLSDALIHQIHQCHYEFSQRFHFQSLLILTYTPQTQVVF